MSETKLDIKLPVVDQLESHSRKGSGGEGRGRIPPLVCDEVFPKNLFLSSELLSDIKSRTKRRFFATIKIKTYLKWIMETDSECCRHRPFKKIIFLKMS